MDDDDQKDGAEKRQHLRAPVTLRVDYDGADDLIGDYTENLSHGGTFVATSRHVELGTAIRLVLSFPGLLEPIALDGVVRWSRTEEDPGVGIAFEPGPGKDRLAQVIERIKSRDPRLVSRVVRILIVEDNPHVAELIRAGLRGSSKRSFEDALQFDFRLAANGKEAVELLRTTEFDVVIIDIYLPVMDGAQVIATARGELGLTALPIIAVSAGGDSARRQALAAGANMFLDKPMRLRQVIDTMRRLMRL
jgi:uncharacterized protein (TIGR02266 family)